MKSVIERYNEVKGETNSEINSATEIKVLLLLVQSPNDSRLFGV